MHVFVSYYYSPALGDIRLMGKGDVLYIADVARERDDWPRLVDALSAAVSRGADVRWL